MSDEKVKVGWGIDQVEKLRTLWSQGMTANDISVALGGTISRNAVIGKAHRMGLSGRPSPIIKKTSARVINLLILTERMCRWPFGDPKHPDFHFCGRDIDFASTYCDEHRALAFTPLKKQTIIKK